MKRKIALLLTLCLLTVVLAGCSGGESGKRSFESVTQYIGPVDSPAPAPQPPQEPIDEGDDNSGSIFANNPYTVSDDLYAEDALREEGLGQDDGMDEGGIDDSDGAPSFDYAASDALATVYAYAGTTPIPLDPVDMPTPTPRSELTFAYQAYTAAQLGITVEGPVYWTVDESVDGQFTLSEPVEQMKDGQLGTLIITATPVTKNYSQSELETEVKQRLSTIGSTNYSEFNRTLTATRYLMGSKGVYANYSGTLANGVKLGGRLHVVCVDKVLYSLHIIYPSEFKKDFENVFAHAKDTLKRAQ